MAFRPQVFRFLKEYWGSGSLKLILKNYYDLKSYSDLYVGKGFFIIYKVSIF